MRNSVRRSRNIGTVKQGYKRRKEFGLPYYWHEEKVFWEKLSDYKKVKRNIKGEEFTFVVEKTRENCFHACTVDDVQEILKHIPLDIYEDLRTIIFRQPKRKEEIFSLVWGRLAFGFGFEKEIKSAILLEAVDYDYRVNVWSKKLNPDAQKELQRLKNDGFEIVETKRNFEVITTLENVRNVQLYRTLLHEIGHYVHWVADVEKFDTLPSSEKEVFAHRFADTVKAELKSKNILPFPRKLERTSIIKDGLDLSDFERFEDDRS